MKAIDSLKRGDQVTVTVWGPEGERLCQSTATGYHSIADAVSDAVDKAHLEMNPEDCVFEVTNLTTAVSHRYRINAHGNLRLIV